MAGLGQVSTYTTSVWHLSALLYDFEVGSPMLKPHHRYWLTTTVPNYLTRDMSVLIVGLTSRTGTDAFNLNLSKLRAAAVEDALQTLELSNGRLLVDTKVAAGEAAARIAGLRDGVEDARWRGVYLSIYDPSKLPPPPQKTPAKFVMRRKHVKVLLSDKPGKGIPMDPQDRRAEAIFQASRKAMDRLSGNQNIVNEEFTLVDQNWTVVKITIKKNVTDGPYIIESLEVDYEWAPFGDRILIDKVQDRYKRIDPRLRDEVTPLSVDAMNDWLAKPRTTYLRSH